MTTSNGILLAVGGGILIGVIGSTVVTHQALGEVRGELASLRNDSAQRLKAVPGEVAELVAGKRILTMPAGPDHETPPKTAQDLLDRIALLPQQPTAEKLALLLGELGDWLMAPEAEEVFTSRTAELQKKLRLRVKAEVEQHLADAVRRTNGGEGVKDLTKARQTLALYPMSNDQSVIEEATSLTILQAQAAGQVEALRRLRYNQWAISQLQLAREYFNKNVSRLPLLKDNSKLIEPMVEYLAPIDPSLLEPVSVQLYESVIERLKDKLSEDSKFRFAEAMVNPAIKRKDLGGF